LVFFRGVWIGIFPRPGLHPGHLYLEVIHLDDEVDQMYSDSYNQVKEQIRQNPEDLDSVLYYLSVSRHLERIADLATNIAEDVTYMIEGEIIRHTFGQ